MQSIFKNLEEKFNKPIHKLSERVGVIYVDSNEFDIECIISVNEDNKVTVIEEMVDLECDETYAYINYIRPIRVSLATGSVESAIVDPETYIDIANLENLCSYCSLKRPDCKNELCEEADFAFIRTLDYEE